MRILVGIIHSVENEFEDCLNSIRGQKGIDAENFIITDLGKSEAHIELYSTFMSRSDEFDLFMKVDADMTIEDPEFFYQISEYFKKHEEVDELQIPVFDAFTAQEVYGLCTYRSSVKWDINNRDPIFTDYGAASTKKHKEENAFQGMVSHCRNPSAYQSWHFGLHKAVKFSQYERGNRINLWASYTHWKNITKLFELSKAPSLNQQAIATRGVMDAIQNHLTSEHIDYKNETSFTLFKRAEKEKFQTTSSLWFPKPTTGFLNKSKFGLTLFFITLLYQRPFAHRKMLMALRVTIRNRF